MPSSFFTADNVMAACAVVTLLSAIGGWALHQKDAAQEREMAGFRDALRGAFKRIDELRDKGEQYVTRAEFQALRVEIRQDIEHAVAPMAGEVRGLRQDLSSLILRMPGGPN